MENIKSIEYYPNGTVKRVEFFLPAQLGDVPRIDWTYKPQETAKTPTSVSYGVAELFRPVISAWNTIEENRAWISL